VKRSIYRNLLVTMLILGASVGLVFPIFARVALDSERALSVLFFGMCISAGLLVGGANYLLFSVVVSRAIQRLVDAMKEVNAGVATRQCSGLECAEGLHLIVESDDPIGATAEAFNSMIDAVGLRLGMEGSIHALLERLATTVEVEDVSRAILRALSEVCGAPLGLL
jgi:HAMP domain-containing protein